MNSHTHILFAGSTVLPSCVTKVQATAWRRGMGTDFMKRLILIMSLSAFAPMLNSCVGNGDEALRRAHVPEEKRVPVLIRAGGKVKFEKTENYFGVVITIHRPGQSTISARWPEGVPYDEHAEVEILDEKWEEGRTLIVRVITNGKCVYDASRCKLHHVVMVRRDVIYASLCYYPISNFKNGEPKLFPNDGKSYEVCHGGPIFTTWRCPVCYEGSERWRKRLGIPEH